MNARITVVKLQNVQQTLICDALNDSIDYWHTLAGDDHDQYRRRAMLAQELLGLFDDAESIYLVLSNT